MSQVFNAETGELSAVTVLELGPCMVVALKTSDRHGYDAVQLGFGEMAGEPTAVADKTEDKEAATADSADKKKNRRRSKRRPNRPQQGYFKAAGCSPRRYLRELRLVDEQDSQGLSVGSELTVGDIFKDVKMVNVSGVSKGKGFAGVIKRWNFSGGRATHGSSFHRAPGSIGQSASPSRVFPGVKMPGRLGGCKITARNLRVMEVDEAQNLMVVRGSVPGSVGELIVVCKAE